MFEKKETSRGFLYLEFIDRYNKKCSFQKSSIASEDCIWLGIDDPDPLIMWGDALKYGIEIKKCEGWVKYPIPKEVSIHTRMHLTKKQCLKLAIKLFKFWLFGTVK